MDKSNGKNEFDSTDFEKRLTNLKDTQDSIQAMSSWCLQHRTFHKKIVTSWLTVLKQGENSIQSHDKLFVEKPKMNSMKIIFS